MKRMVWLGLGAAGGILAYRKGGQLLEQARTQGIVVTAQQALASGRGALTTAQRTLRGAPDQSNAPGRGARSVRRAD